MCPPARSHFTIFDMLVQVLYDWEKLRIMQKKRDEREAEDRMDYLDYVGV